MVNKVLSKRRYSSKKGVKVFSERSGQPFDLSEMVREPGTNLLVHRSESDGKWNRTEVFIDPIVPSDAQTLEYTSAKPTVVNEDVVDLEDFLFD